MKTYTLKLDENDLKVLVALLDAAVKALGLQAAEAAVALTKRVSEDEPQPIVPELVDP